MNKKKKKKYIIFGIIFVVVVILINILIILVSKIDEKEEPVRRETVVVEKITCTFTDTEEMDHTIELELENNKLMTKVEKMTWEDKEKETCDFYTKRLETYNEIAGITDTLTCNDTSGTRVTTYVFDTLDTVEAKPAELKYIGNDGLFDVDGYINFREKKGSRCKINE